MGFNLVRFIWLFVACALVQGGQYLVELLQISNYLGLGEMFGK